MLLGAARAGEGGRLLPPALRADRLDPGRGRRRHLHRRQRPAAGAQPAAAHLAGRRRAVHRQHLAPGLGAAGARRRAVGVRRRGRRRHLPAVRPALPGRADGVVEGAPVHRAQHRGHPRRARPRRRRASSDVRAQRRRSTTATSARRRAPSATSGCGTRRVELGPDLPAAAGDPRLLRDRRRRRRPLRRSTASRPRSISARASSTPASVPQRARGRRSTSPSPTATAWCWRRRTRTDEQRAPTSSSATCPSSRPTSPTLELDAARHLLRRGPRAATSSSAPTARRSTTRTRTRRSSPSTTGEDGVELGSLVRRAAFALRFGDLNPLISDFIDRRLADPLHPRRPRAGARRWRRSSPSTPTRTRWSSTAGSCGSSTPTRPPTATPTRSGPTPTELAGRQRPRPRLQLRAQLGEGRGRRLRRHGHASTSSTTTTRSSGPTARRSPSCSPTRRDARRAARRTSATPRTCSGCRPTCGAATTSTDPDDFYNQNDALEGRPGPGHRRRRPPRTTSPTTQGQATGDEPAPPHRALLPADAAAR